MCRRRGGDAGVGWDFWIADRLPPSPLARCRDRARQAAAHAPSESWRVNLKGFANGLKDLRTASTGGHVAASARRSEDDAFNVFILSHMASAVSFLPCGARAGVMYLESTRFRGAPDARPACPPRQLHGIHTSRGISPRVPSISPECINRYIATKSPPAARTQQTFKARLI